MRRCGLGLLLLLTGCATASAPPPQPVAQQPDAEPPYRQLIAEKLPTMFAADSQMHSVAISGVRPITTPVGPEWRVCLRGTANSAGGGSGMRTYVVLINKRHEIIDRRLAEPGDGCDRERFEPLRPA